MWKACGSERRSVVVGSANKIALSQTLVGLLVVLVLAGQR